MLDTTNLLLPMPNPVNGSVNGEKDNSSQALHDTPRVGCAVRPFGGFTVSEWPSADIVDNQGSVEKVEVVSRTHTRSRAEEQLDSSLGVTRPTLPAPAQTIGKLLSVISRTGSNEPLRDTKPR